MKVFTKKYLVWWIGLAIITLYFVTRLYNILALPIFTDEAIYIRWSQIAANDASWRFISLTDGKQPLFIWACMITLRFFDDPLLAGRMVSVLAGLFSMIGIFFLANELFNNKRIALLASLFYVLYPFALVYDRMALYESIVSLFVVWSIYFGVLLVRYIRLDLSMILGMVAGLGMLAKTSANFGLILLPFSLVLFDWKDKKRNKKFLRWVVFVLIAVVIANAMYAVLRLSPFYYIIAEKNNVFVYSPQEWIKSPFAFVFSNSRVFFEWLTTYTTIPFLLLIASAFVVSKKFLREKIFLLLCFLIPFIALSFFGKLVYPRHLLFMTPPLLILGAFALYHLLLFVKNSWLKGVVSLVFLVLFIFADWFIMTNIAKAPIPKAEKEQYVTSWAAGTGVKETVAYLSEKAQNEKIYVGTGGTFGLMPYALEIYLHDNPNIITKGFWPVEGMPPKEVIDAAKKMPTYFIMYQDCPSCPHRGVAPVEWKVDQVLQVDRLEPNSYFTLYKMRSQ